uniref:Arginase family protein n=1 Tax=Mimiviridae sp. ChoanoV1 TaxID=2596887 RepID=A0A5B8HVK0_9VIRU|nr:arginase family protein [Mimiviridae sp. ChoanoV1]
MKNILSLSIPINFGQKKDGVELGCEEIYNNYLKKNLYNVNFINYEHKIFDYDKSEENHKIMFELHKYIRELINKYDFFILLGGDHSISMATISGLYLNHPREKCVIWLDAHTDCNNIEKSETGNIHGMPVAGLLGDLEEPYNNYKCLDYHEICYIGPRSIDDFEDEYIKKHNILTLGTDKINEDIDSVLQKVEEFINDREVHLSFDIDVMDPELISSTGVPEKNGINMNQMKKILLFIGEFNIKSMDIVELNPKLGNYEKSFNYLKDLLNIYFKIDY